MSKHKIFESMEKDIDSSHLNEDEKCKLYKNLHELKNKKLNIMITGATGSGKSSTINAMFDVKWSSKTVHLDRRLN